MSEGPKPWDMRIREQVLGDGSKTYTPQIYCFGWEVEPYRYSYYLWENRSWYSLPDKFRGSGHTKVWPLGTLEAAKEDLANFKKNIIDKKIIQTNFIKYP